MDLNGNIMTNKVGRWEIDDLTKKGWKSYVMENTDMSMLSKVLYHRFFLDNFYIGQVMFVKNRKEE